MKIGILSMQRINNYGSFMQALSLKTILNELGHEVMFVDYEINVRIKDINNKYKQKERRKKNFQIKLRDNAIISSLLKIRRDIKKIFGYKYTDNCFESCYPLLNMSSKKNYRAKVDVLIIGSDEVFNCLQENEAVGYSLELFGKNNRAKRLISYAASFGSTTEDELEQYGVKDEIAHYLKMFDDISVRDENSFKIVNSLCGIKPKCHLDPVLVGNIEKMNWKPVDKKGYVIVYGYANRFTQEEGKAIKEFAAQKGLKTIALAGRQDFCDESIWCRPDEIISYFKNSDYIITDTFHGTIFSVICEKQFVTFCRKKNNVKKGNATNEEKLTDMMTKMGITDRIIKSLSDIAVIIDKPIDFEKIKEIRRREREHTINYLKDNLKQ